MSHTALTLDEWTAREGMGFSIDEPEAVQEAVDRMMASLRERVELLGFGEALHGAEEILVLRNRLFARLAQAHGYSAIALESSFPKGRLVNEYVAGRGAASYEGVRDEGFGHGFGRLEANRELVEWMRQYNAEDSQPLKLHFYGFDIPDSPTGIGGPRKVLRFAVDYLAAIGDCGRGHAERIEALLGEDAAWENPAQYADPTKSIGLSPEAASLRIATEDLITEFHTRRPELVARSGADAYTEALQHACVGRQLLNYHAAVARNAGVAHLLGIRDALMANTLAWIVARERRRGKVLVFAHNAHLQRGKMAAWPEWQKAMGGKPFAWWPAGSHLNEILGSRYAVIGSGVGTSEANGIGPPEASTLEARLMALAGTACLIPTHNGQNLSAAEIAALPTRSGSTQNLSYTGLAAQSFTDFDWLAVLNSATYHRGGRPLPQPQADSGQ